MQRRTSEQEAAGLDAVSCIVSDKHQKGRSEGVLMIYDQTYSGTAPPQNEDVYVEVCVGARIDEEFKCEPRVIHRPLRWMRKYGWHMIEGEYVNTFLYWIHKAGEKCCSQVESLCRIMILSGFIHMWHGFHWRRRRRLMRF